MHTLAKWVWQADLVGGGAGAGSGGGRGQRGGGAGTAGRARAAAPSRCGCSSGPGCRRPRRWSESRRGSASGIACEQIATNEQLEARLRAGERYDLITPSDFMVERLAARGLPAPPPPLPGRDALAPWVRKPVWDPQERRAVPLAFGTTGYLYDRARPPGAGTWPALLAPPPGVTVGLLDEHAR